MTPVCTQISLRDAEFEFQGSDSRVKRVTGCAICLEKKVKCDKGQPSCSRCVRLNRDCDYTPRPRKKYTRNKQSKRQSREADSVSASSQGLSNDQSASPHEDHSSISTRDIVPLADFNLESSLSPKCREILSPADHVSIQYFLAPVPFIVDTRSPEHCGTAIVWSLAQHSRMVLHMVCATGGLRLCYENRIPAFEFQQRKSDAAEHYGAGLRLLAEATQNGIETSNFTFVLATLWLMIAYEQKCGDGCGVGLIAHLKGAASLLQGQLASLRRVMDRHWLNALSRETSGALLEESHEEIISPAAIRMIVWISLIDGGAALNGLGGTFNNLLGTVMADLADDVALSRLRGFVTLQRYSNLVYREVSGPSYSQFQMIEDLESAQLFAFYAETGQLRFMLSKLVTTEHNEIPDLERDTALVLSGIRDVEMRYAEFLSVVNLFDLPCEASPRRFIINIRFIVSFFHAVLLCFLRITRGKAVLNSKQRHSLSEIMNLAFKIHRDGGTEALNLIGWPLLVTAVETDDMVHRAWILDRFDVLVKQGENFRRAREALRLVFSQQRMDERQLDFISLLRCDDIDRFVI